MVESVFKAAKAEELFKQKLINIACQLVQASEKAANHKPLRLALLAVLEDWLKAKNLKVPAGSTVLRLTALRVLFADSGKSGNTEVSGLSSRFVRLLPGLVGRSSKVGHF